MANQAALEQYMKLCVLYARKTGLSRIQFAKWTACSGNIRIQFVFLNGTHIYGMIYSDEIHKSISCM